MKSWTWINEAQLSEVYFTKRIFGEDHRCEDLGERHQRLLSAKGSQREAHTGVSEG
jgi:hypothetical protein